MDVQQTDTHIQAKRRDISGSIYVYLAILLGGCAVASLVLALGIRESRNEAARRFELDGKLHQSRKSRYLSMFRYIVLTHVQPSI